ncbi:MAG: hypothetical protein IJD57_00385 [Candidatus Gastranaerophilales bacterium]|nr:hypothetical protein [Candidatus Gastranaerophilales bacterium]
MNATKNDKISLLILTILFTLFAFFFFGKFGNILIDFSRECYIPLQMNNGEKLYSDIFLIYGFFGYFINSIILKFTQNVNSLLILANIISYTILILFYIISRKFLNEKQSFFFSFLFLTLSIFSNSTFSFVFPYSFSTLWAVLGCYLVIFSLLYDKKNLLFLSLGFIFVNKIEFFIIFGLISIFSLLFKKEKFLKNSFWILFFPILNLLYIAINQIPIDDIIKNANYITTMAKTSAIAYFYKGMGSFFEINQFLFNLKNLFIVLFFSFISYQFFKKEQIFATMSLILPFSIIHFYNVFNLSILILIPIFFITLRKKLLSSPEILLVIFTLALNFKCLFKTSTFSYSNFGFALIIMVLYVLFLKVLNKKWLVYFLIIFLIGFNIENINYFAKNQKIGLKTTIGQIQLNKDDFETFKKTNEYIKTNIQKDENLIVIPEGQIFNFIHKKPWNYYNSTFTPLDFETFGEENIIQKLNENKTDWIIFYPRNTHEYGAKTICYDYGIDFCEYIMDNYERKTIIEDKFKVLIFKIKK